MVGECRHAEHSASCTDKGSVYKSYSKDKGVSWTAPEPMKLDSPLSPQSMKRIPSTGHLLIVWNNSKDKRFPLTAAISKDEGETWVNVRNLDEDASAHDGCGPVSSAMRSSNRLS